MPSRRVWIVAVVAVALTAVAAIVVGVTVSQVNKGSSPDVKLLVPAYWAPDLPDTCTEAYVTGGWSTLVAGGSKVIAIINPNNGPAYTGTDATVQCLPHLAKARVTSVGYVATGYGKRNMGDIKRDITRYQTAYQAAGVGGIFFDEGVSWWDVTNETVPFYQEIAGFARDSGFPYLVVNPGGRFPPQYLDTFDLVVGFESAGAQWRTAENHGICPTPKFAAPDDTVADAGYCNGKENCDINGDNCTEAKRGQVAAIVICQSSGNVTTVLDQAKESGYETVYVTDKGCDKTNPYGGLGSFWTKELEVAKA